MSTPRLYLVLVLSTLSVMSVMGCAEDLCKEQPPGFQVDLTISELALAVQIQSLKVELFAAGLEKRFDLDPRILKARGSTAFTVEVGQAGHAGFRVEVTVEALDAEGARLLLSQQGFDSSGDACNFFSMSLDPATATDQRVDPPPADTGSDVAKVADAKMGAETAIDMGPDLHCWPKSCAEQGIECGVAGNGCGQKIQCPGCPNGGSCVSGTCVLPPVDCSGIADADNFTLCESGNDFCNGVFLGGEGCTAFCAAAGLVCTAHFGSGPACNKEPHNVYTCTEDTGNNNDWCDCGRP